MKLGLLLFVFTLLISPHFAHATLGEKEASVVTDYDSVPNAQNSVQSFNGYAVHTITNDGMIVKEYLKNGVVFALSWKGVQNPDFEKIFGTYFTKYKTAILNKPRVHGRRDQKITEKDLIVHTGGHMRALKGYAIVPSLMPANLNIPELK